MTLATMIIQIIIIIMTIIIMNILVLSKKKMQAKKSTQKFNWVQIFQNNIMELMTQEGMRQLLHEITTIII